MRAISCAASFIQTRKIWHWILLLIKYNIDFQIFSLSYVLLKYFDEVGACLRASGLWRLENQKILKR